jgi:hypothetical protein
MTVLDMPDKAKTPANLVDSPPSRPALGCRNRLWFSVFIHLFG